MSSDTLTAQLSRVSYPSLRTGGTGAQEQQLEQAQARGHAAGYAAGLRQASDEFEALKSRLEAEHADALAALQEQSRAALTVLDAAARALNERALPLVADAQDALAAAALDLAEAVIGRELSDIENSARSAFTRAMSHVDSSACHTVRMNPADLDFLADDIAQAPTITFAADPTLAPGDVITEFPDGYLDGRIDNALTRVKAELLGGAA